MAPKKTAAVSVADGKVTVNLGIRMSADFQSASYDLGLTLPIGEGETPEEAVERIRETASNAFASSADGQMAHLADQISEIKKDFKQRQK